MARRTLRRSLISFSHRYCEIFSSLLLAGSVVPVRRSFSRSLSGRTL